MALITCSECGREISDKAANCPHCGVPMNTETNKKFCKHCGEQIDKECIICPKCGKQVENLQGNDKNIVINNTASAAAVNVNRGVYGKPKDKWVALILCILFGFLGIHKFYEGKGGMGIIYLLTFGLFGIGWFIDIILILLKPNPYYV